MKALAMSRSAALADAIIRLHRCAQATPTPAPTGNSVSGDQHQRTAPQAPSRQHQTERDQNRPANDPATRPSRPRRGGGEGCQCPGDGHVRVQIAAGDRRMPADCGDHIGDVKGCRCASRHQRHRQRHRTQRAVGVVGSGRQQARAPDANGSAIDGEHGQQQEGAGEQSKPAGQRPSRGSADGYGQNRGAEKAEPPEADRGGRAGGARLCAGAGERGPFGEQRHRRGDRDIDPERPAPQTPSGEDAAEERSAQGAHAPDAGHRGDRAGMQMRRKDPPDGGVGECCQQTAADTLQRPPGEKNPDRRRQRAGGAAGGEQQQARPIGSAQASPPCQRRRERRAPDRPDESNRKRPGKKPDSADFGHRRRQHRRDDPQRERVDQDAAGDHQERPEIARAEQDPPPGGRTPVAGSVDRLGKTAIRSVPCHSLPFHLDEVTEC